MSARFVLCDVVTPQHEQAAERMIWLLTHLIPDVLEELEGTSVRDLSLDTW